MVLGPAQAQSSNFPSSMNDGFNILVNVPKYVPPKPKKLPEDVFDSTPIGIITRKPSQTPEPINDPSGSLPDSTFRLNKSNADVISVAPAISKCEAFHLDAVVINVSLRALV